LKLLFFMLLVSGSIAAMTLIPAEYRVEGTGQLMPVVQRVIYAPWDGEVVKIHVASGEIVEANQVLVTLRNDELNTRILETDNKLAEKREHFTSLSAEIDLGSLRTSPDNATRLRGQLAQTQIEINGLAQRLAALQAQQRLLTVRAPIAGTIATFQLEQLLLNRPVSRGERLLEVMDESGEWHLELEVPEQRMGHLLDAQKEQGAEPLIVEFVLATDPEATFSGTLRQMSTRTALSEKHGTAVAVNVELNASQLRHRRIGSEVLGKISCGQRSLAYVLFGDVVEFVRRRVW
jgi:multidrug efflux pump subunit AcrA (membrane-fusion protein)